jgi:nucleoside-diphosphate-sugar epimerase
MNLEAPADIGILEDQLSAPSERVVRAMSQLDGDLVVLGAGGKMGPTLSRMAQRANELAGIERRVIAVSRFREDGLRDRMHAWGIETQSCNLLDESAVASLPDAPTVMFMTGFKFGAGANPGLTWAMNCYVPALVSRKYRNSRIGVFSSGNIYGLTSVEKGGSCETDPPRPVGEYAITVLGRERMFEHFSVEMTMPIVQLRLNYATELRYGVLVDIARQVASEEPVDLTTGWVNVIWQTEANAMALESLLHAASPPRIMNLAGPELLRVRDVAEQFGKLLGKPVRFSGVESSDALLSNGSASYELLGKPQVTAERMIEWTAQWLKRGGAFLNKPTHFESRDGQF